MSFRNQERNGYAFIACIDSSTGKDLKAAQKILNYWLFIRVFDTFSTY